VKRRSSRILAILVVVFTFCGRLSADDSKSSPPELVPPGLKLLAGIASDISKINTGVDAAIKLGQLVGFIPKQQTELQVVSDIRTTLEDGLDLLYDQIVLVPSIGLAANANSAVDTLREFRNMHPDGPLDLAAAPVTAALNATGAYIDFISDPRIFKRRYDPRRTDGGTFWKDILVLKNPEFWILPLDTLDPVIPLAGPDHSDGRVYDWRSNLPFLMHAISLRLTARTLIDPEWSTKHDVEIERQITEYVKTLNDNIEMMLEGVRCGWIEGTSFLLSIACADIYTGISVDYFYENTNSVEEAKRRIAGLPALEEQFVHQVLLQMPIFEMRSMRDSLNSYLVHAPDLTASLQRISLEHSQNLCLEVQGAAPPRARLFG
jgi:hypothetical protein